MLNIVVLLWFSHQRLPPEEPEEGRGLLQLSYHQKKGGSEGESFFQSSLAGGIQGHWPKPGGLVTLKKPILART